MAAFPKRIWSSVSRLKEQTHWFAFLASVRLQVTLIFLGGIALLGVGLWIQGREWASRVPLLPWILLVFGLGVIVIGSRMIESGSPPQWLSKIDRSLTALMGVKRWQLLALACSPLLASVAYLAAGDGLRMINPVIAVAAWIAAVGLVLLGGWEWGKRGMVISRSIAVATGLLVGIAFLIRVYAIANVPPVLTGDEASAGLAAVDVLNGLTNNPFRAGWFSFPALHSFVQAIPIALLGQNIPALRLTAVVAGALTVGAVYLVARQMFTQWTALMAAIFLAAFHFHNHFSRIGLNNIWDGLWFVVILGLLWYAFQHNSRIAYLVAGLALGFSQYFYVSVRILFLLVPILVLVSAYLAGKSRKVILPNMVIMGLVALTVMMPLAWYYLGHSDEFWAPLRRVTVLGGWMQNEVRITGLPAWRVLLHQLGLGFQGFAHIPLRMWYQPGTPLLRFIPAVLFFIGLGLLLRKPRHSSTLLLTFWVLAFGIMNAFSESAPAAQRYVGVAPAAAMLVAYGLAESGSLLSDLWPRYRHAITYAALIFVLLLSLDELRFYFREYTPKSDLGGENTLVAARLADYLQTKSGDWQVAFFGGDRMGYYSIASLQYLAPHIEGVDINHPWGSPENPRLQDGSIIFVFLPEMQADLGSVKADFPGGRAHQERTADGILLYWIYEFASESGDSSQSPELFYDYSYPYPIDYPASIPGGYP